VTRAKLALRLVPGVGSRTPCRYWKRLRYSFYVTPETLKTPKTPHLATWWLRGASDDCGEYSVGGIQEVCTHKRLPSHALISILGEYFWRYHHPIKLPLYPYPKEEFMIVSIHSRGLSPWLRIASRDGASFALHRSFVLCASSRSQHKPKALRTLMVRRLPCRHRALSLQITLILGALPWTRARSY
jgi:hypothetical protein